MRTFIEHWRHVLGQELIGLGLWVMPNGRIKNDLSKVFHEWSVKIIAECEEQMELLK